MIKVDRNKIEIPQVFFSSEMKIAEENLSKFYSGRKETRSQKRFLQNFESEFRTPILKALNSLFNSKCAYCESKLINKKSYNYDHFRPKNGARGMEKEFAGEHYWWLTYEWANFYSSCNHCNQYKATWFPVSGKRAKIKTPYKQIILEENNLLIDPCKDNPEDHLTFDFNGTIKANTERGNITIEILQLNRKKLIDARKQTINDLYSDWEELLKFWPKLEQNWDKIVQITSYWHEILKDTSKRPYLAASKTLIKDRINKYEDIKAFILEERFKWVLDFDFDLHKDVPFPPKEINIENTSLALKETSKTLQVSKTISPSLTRQIYLDALELKNYKCFSNLKLKFKQKSNSEEQNWILFLGENGVGKSSIIKAIAIALSPQSYLDKIAKEVIQNKLLKDGESEGYIELTYNGGEKLKVSFNDTNKILTASLENPIVNVLGYGSTRLLPKKTITHERGRFSGVKYQNLFDYTIALKNADEWLLKRSQTKFNRAATTIKDLMLLSQDDLLIRDERKIYIKSNNTRTPISELSDGYKTIYALAVDIMSTLSSENITYDLAEGIILIDEIGTHLHPRWKMQVVQRLRYAFPKLQFIATTHEPLCLRGLKDKETFVLTRNQEKEIIALHDLPDPSELRIDQILTSDFFGLNSTLDPKTEAIFKEYYGILAKDETIRTEKENIRLHELNVLVPKIKHLGDNLRDELVYYVIDELLAKRVKKDGFKIKEELKEEARKKVENLWNSIDSND